jgi:hypothetical protein
MLVQLRDEPGIVEEENVDGGLLDDGAVTVAVNEPLGTETASDSPAVME